MSLIKYRSKRDLQQTTEPAGGKSSSPALRFCVQKHDARNLHYDFRLEFRGVLLSWAVPKGPSMDPKDKRLAIMVEDHPLDYQYFEGVIPKGNYGAGTVEIWDAGTYEIPNAANHKAAESQIAEGIRKGHLIFELHGEKLHGLFVLQKLKKDADDSSWLLIKKDAESEHFSDNVAESKPKSKGVAKIKKTKMPEFIPPMLATLIEGPFDDDQWLFETKWDGYRAFAYIDKGKVNLKSRANQPWNKKFPNMVKVLQEVDDQVVFDGELIILDSKGKPQFQLMQNYQKDQKGDLCYCIFDLLYKDGIDLRELPLIDRKEFLRKYLKKLDLPQVRFSEYSLHKGISTFKKAEKQQLEGITGKKMDSTYQSRRSRDWVKIKTSLRQEVVIGGFTEPRGSRKKFGSLLVGIFDDNKELMYAGHVGGGFNETLLDEVYKQLTHLTQKECPFKNKPKANAAVTWVKPQLVCEVSFAEWTKDNIMRQPIFHGLRTDKKPKSIKKETPSIPPTKETKTRSKSKNEEESPFTHLDKIYWEEEKYTKGDLIQYYTDIAPFILPYLKGRPIMLHRYPGGLKGKEFYQKDINFAHPEWLKIYPIQHEGSIVHYLGIEDLRSLLYAVNLGSIDIHPFLSRYDNLDKPDFCIIDLDPRAITFDKAVEVALVAHEIMEGMAIKHYIKTSGSKGLHLMIPLHGKYDYEQSRQFAEIISLCIQKEIPSITSMERSPSKRQGKVYLDCLQNRIAQTLVAPYSVRPRPLATVSTPLEWSEVNKHLDLTDFTIKTIPKRLKEKGDLLKGILKESVNIKMALTRLKKHLSQ